MTKHTTNAYKDGYKWVVFCQCCGQEEPLSENCPGQYISNRGRVKEENIDRKGGSIELIG